MWILKDLGFSIQPAYTRSRQLELLFKLLYKQLFVVRCWFSLALDPITNISLSGPGTNYLRTPSTYQFHANLIDVTQVCQYSINIVNKIASRHQPIHTFKHEILIHLKYTRCTHIRMLMFPQFVNYVVGTYLALLSYFQSIHRCNRLSSDRTTWPKGPKLAS